jgi:hypothetical protein
VYTSLNSRPMYPLPTMAIQSGTNSNLSAWSLVITVFPAGQHSAIKNPQSTI